MAKTEALGLCTCPECGHKDAEIKLAKSGYAYRYCPDCNSQYFARNTVQHDRLLAKMRKAESVQTVTVTETKPPVKKQSGSILDD